MREKVTQVGEDGAEFDTGESCEPTPRERGQELCTEQADSGLILAKDR